MKNDTRRFTIIWFLLVGTTLVAWALGHQPASGPEGLPAGIIAGILILAFAKIALVMAFFMDIRTAPFSLILVAAVWLVGECGALLWCLAG